jgi:hypothetical protein
MEWASQVVPAAATNSFSDKHPLPQHLFKLEQTKQPEEQQQRRRRESNPAILLQNARYIKMSVVDRQKAPIVSKPEKEEMGLTCQGFLLVPNTKTPPIVK